MANEGKCILWGFGLGTETDWIGVLLRGSIGAVTVTFTVLAPVGGIRGPHRSPADQAESWVLNPRMMSVAQGSAWAKGHAPHPPPGERRGGPGNDKGWGEGG